MNRYLLILFTILLLPVNAMAELRVDLKQGVSESLPIAMSGFHPEEDDFKGMARGLAEIVEKNLVGSGLFRAVDSAAFVQDKPSVAQEGLRFAEWRATGAQAVISGSVRAGDDGRPRVEFRLWDVFSQKQLVGMAYTTTQSNWRRIAHIISDEIYKRLTGEGAYFDTRIVYIAETGPPEKRVKRLAIMDQDGHNHKYLTDGTDLVLTPRFSPTQQTITYMSYGRTGPQVYLYDISTGAHDLLGDFPGMTFAPRFSPDGKKVIMSLAVRGNSDLYEYHLDSKRKMRLTNNSAIDTSPSYAPDGKRIVFESDRGGSQQLYILNLATDKAERITFGDGRYANPVWSPRGDLIAFTRMYKGKFYIGVIRPDGSGERLITTAHHVEGPTWSPNGRVLSYFKERPIGRYGMQRQSKVYTIDITGFHERELKMPRDGSDPAWSPLNP